MTSNSVFSSTIGSSCLTPTFEVEFEEATDILASTSKVSSIKLLFYIFWMATRKIFIFKHLQI